MLNTIELPEVCPHLGQFGDTFERWCSLPSSHRPVIAKGNKMTSFRELVEAMRIVPPGVVVSLQAFERGEWMTYLILIPVIEARRDDDHLEEARSVAFGVRVSLCCGCCCRIFLRKVDRGWYKEESDCGGGGSRSSGRLCEEFVPLQRHVPVRDLSLFSDMYLFGLIVLARNMNLLVLCLLVVHILRRNAVS